MSLVEFKSRVYGSTRFFVNPAHIIAVYSAPDGCFLVTSELREGGRNVHVLVDEPLTRVLQKLGADPASLTGPLPGPSPRPRDPGPESDPPEGATPRPRPHV
ncbi:hypothetical protein [Aquabacter spiritensis]|uniref:Uncharacterized protein n=1 Tax=Aquabacter spiritensis TaxID=933073 RepID=A0A4R3LZW8_9HYPH|nr:hypothetical protein [Aquabacter spiritensis]TCT06242.1 hypothetical protein EDC64_103346 [Aquabacter spiritensis]